MYIETRFFNDGKVMAKLHKGFVYPKLDPDYDKCDFYIESINPRPGHKVRPTNEASQEYDFKSLQEWIEEMFIELDDIIPLVYALKSGSWIDITRYSL